MALSKIQIIQMLVGESIQSTTPANTDTISPTLVQGSINNLEIKPASLLAEITLEIPEAIAVGTALRIFVVDFGVTTLTLSMGGSNTLVGGLTTLIADTTITLLYFGTNKWRIV
jgi:hypothetical protein